MQTQRSKRPLLGRNSVNAAERNMQNEHKPLIISPLNAIERVHIMDVLVFNGLVIQGAVISAIGSADRH